MKVVWDENKNRTNKRKHKISFEDASTVFYDPLLITLPDPDHSWYEFRFVTIGETKNGKLTVVCHTEIRRNKEQGNDDAPEHVTENKLQKLKISVFGKGNSGN